MPWKEAVPVEKRWDFVQCALRREQRFSALCRMFGVSRQNGYKWVERFKTLGRPGLEELSRRPKNSPFATPNEQQQMLVALRHKWPNWGPRKLLDVLEKKHPSVRWPAASTVGTLLVREGLVKPRRLRHKTPAYEHPFLAYVEPNDVWCADFKGQFLLRGGRYCYPLTVTDGVSRYLLECRSLPGIHEKPARRALEQLFREYGMPQAIRTDNGPPFASTLAVCGLSRLAVWLVRLGIRPERIEPGKPQQNGRHERMHRTLKQETTHPPAHTLEAQQRVFDSFRRAFNEERPHEALGMKRPAEVYRSSPRQYPEKLNELEYPSWNTVRVVDANGCICVNYTPVFVGRTLVRERIGLEPIDDGVWLVRFGFLEIGRLDERTGKMSKVGLRWREKAA